MLSSHTTDWILTELPLPALSCLLYHQDQQSDDLYSRDLRTRIILFLHKMCLYKRLSEFLLNFMCHPHVRLTEVTRVRSLMNALAWECLCEISRNGNTLFIAYFIYIRSCRVVVVCLFLWPLMYFILTCLHLRLTEFFLNWRCLLCLAIYIAW